MRRAILIPRSRKRVTISRSAMGLPSRSMISLITSLTLSEAVKKSEKGTTCPLGSMTYLPAVARLTVDSCRPVTEATWARVSGLRCRTPWRKYSS